MCGISGYITKKNVKLTTEQKIRRNNIFKALMYAMQERGTDSTGIAYIKNARCYTLKKTGDSYGFMKDKKVKKALAQGPDIVLGHTRFATTGEITAENAHPFVKGNIVGVHNGMIQNYKTIAPSVNVDSEAVFELLSKHNNDYQKAFSEVSGSCALVWLDIRNLDTIYLVSHTNPLAVVTLEELQTIFFVSTKEAMQAVIEAAYGIKERKIWSPFSDIVYKVTRDFHIEKQKVAFKTYVSSTASYPYAGTSGNWDKYNDDPYYRKSEWENELDDIDTTEIENIEWQIRNEACEMCNKHINPKKQKGFYWNFHEYVVICHECGDAVKVNEYDYSYISYKDYKKSLTQLYHYRQAENKKEPTTTALSLIEKDSSIVH